MSKLIDLSGQRIERWTVISFEGRDKHRKALWLCKCECGKEKVITGEVLRKGSSQSCGCLQKERASASSKKHGKCGTAELRNIRHGKTLSLGVSIQKIRTTPNGADLE